MDVITKAISLSGITLDFVVCAVFSIRLFRVEKEKPQNALIRHFRYYFLFFGGYLLITPLYLGQPGTISVQVQRIAFLLSFIFLFIISNIILAMFLQVLNLNEKLRKTIQAVWGVMCLGAWLYMVTFINPSQSVWGFNNFSISLVMLLIGAPFLAAVSLFFYNGYKDKKARGKYFLLGCGFLFVILGGPLHQFSYAPLFLIADFITSLGFLSSFLALLI